MKSHIITLLLLVGIICAPLIAAHSHDWIEAYQEGQVEVSPGSDNNSAEAFMNEMEARQQIWENDTEAREAWVQIWEEEHNETLHSSGDYTDEEEI
ncbi:hypothetical protein KR032_000690, partial [Drosophila birchii]